jgi:hypothetical protein
VLSRADDADAAGGEHGRSPDATIRTLCDE